MRAQGVHQGKRCFLFCLGALIALGAARGVRADQADAALAARFLRDAPPQWAEYARLAKRLQGSSSFQLTQTLADLQAANRYELKRCSGSRLLQTSAERTREGKQDYQILEVVGVNPRYAFHLKRKTPTSPWVVAQLTDLKNYPVPPAIDEKIDRYEDGLDDLAKMDNEPLAEAVRKPYFRVVRCRAVSDGGEELVEVAFDSFHQVGEEEDSLIQSGTLVLDPGRFWCVRSYDVRTKTANSTGTMQFRVLELGQADESLPVPRRAVFEKHFVFTDGTTNRQQWQFEYNLSVPRRTPGEEEFTLSAFGLPEPPGLGGPKRFLPLYVWFALGGLACLAVGVLCQILKRRATRVATN
jgi:hypothetical protein